jgi:phospholipase C
LGIVLAVAAVGTSAWLNGCTPTSSQSAGVTGGVGEVAVALSLDGTTLNTVTYSITGPGGFMKSGSLDVSHSSTLSGLISGLPAGMGYSITLNGTATDGTTTCLGSAGFTIMAQQTAMVSVHMTCHQPPTTGSILVNGTLNVCPVVDGVSASPAEVMVGSSISLAATAHDADGGPSPLSYHWSVSSGALSDPTSATPSFTCTVAGPATLTVSVSDGDPAPGCAGMQTAMVTCSGHTDNALALPTATKIKHLVVIFGENISYDHYFGTYPNAANLTGETTFTAAAGTPASNNLATPLDPTAGFAPLALNLLGMNPNLAAGNGTNASNPIRLSAAQASTQDQGHNYLPEQEADDNGLMDLFPKFTGSAGTFPLPPPPAVQTKALVMGYFDGNTLGTFWSLAQQYSMNDNSWSTVFGPSTPGAINLISGQTNGFDLGHVSKPPGMMAPTHVVGDGAGNFTLIGDTDPYGDVCSTAGDQNLFTGPNIGDLLNAKKISWGWFNGGFDLKGNVANCASTTAQTVPNAAGISADYIPHHQPFQYYASTANPTHARPSSLAAIGSSVQADGMTADPANHQYDSHDFFDALAAGNLPAVVYLKAPAFQDGHPGYSNPVDEQNFVASVYNALKNAQEWTSTALVILYDDSDGWYDHQMPPIVNPSATAVDALNGAGVCNTGAQQNGAAPTTPLNGVAGVPVQGRCGYGTRQPLMVISPFAKKNYIDHTLTDQSSVLKFVEDNWLAGQRIQLGGSFDTIAGTIQNMLSF